MWAWWGSTLLLRGHRWVYDRLADLICSWAGGAVTYLNYQIIQLCAVLNG